MQFKRWASVNVGPASTLGSIDTAMGECPVFAEKANVWFRDSVMTAIIAGLRNLINPDGL